MHGQRKRANIMQLFDGHMLEGPLEALKFSPSSSNVVSIGMGK